MTDRKTLRNDLIAAWEKTIFNRYRTQEIDSERALQAHFCAAILMEFESANRMRRLFIEPTIQLHSTDGIRKPDILICNNHKIIGIVELKYKPRWRAEYNKDLDTLKLLEKNHAEVSVSNKRYLGPRKTVKTYELASNALFCWAAVYSGKRIKNPAFIEAELKNNFLALHAITDTNTQPEIITSPDVHAQRI